MSRIRLAAITFLCLFLSLTLPAFAQDALPLTQAYTSSDGKISVSFPDAWVAKPGPTTPDLLDVTFGNSEAAAAKDIFAGMSTLAAESSLHLLIGSPAAMIGPIIAIEDTDEPVAFLQSYIKEYNKFLRYEVSDAAAITINNLPAARLDFDAKNTAKGSLLSSISGSSILAMATLSTAADELSTWEITAQAVVESLSDSAASQVAAEVTPNPALDLEAHFVSSDDLFAFDYPADWVTDFNNREAALLDLSLATSGRVRHSDPLTRSTDKFAPGEARVTIFSGAKADLLKSAHLQDDATTATILTALLAQANSISQDFEPVETVEDAHYPTARAFFSAPNLADGVVLLLDYGSGIVGLVSMYYAPGERLRWEATVQAMIASFHYGESPEVTPEATQAAG